MALTLEANYSKKIGLPQYSSHQFSLTIKTELTDIKQVEQATSHLYGLLQGCVDHEIQKIGYLPLQVVDSEGNLRSKLPLQNGQRSVTNGKYETNSNGEWHCSPKQKELILKVMEEHKLDKVEVEKLSTERFGKALTSLDKKEASALIDELLRSAGQPVNRVAKYQKPTSR